MVSFADALDQHLVSHNQACLDCQVRFDTQHELDEIWYVADEVLIGFCPSTVWLGEKNFSPNENS